MEQIRDLIKSLRRVKARDLKPNPRNWRTHPEAQEAALRGVLGEIGYADACLARELPDGTLELVDGHLRAGLDPDQKVPVLILDLDEAEADKLLTVLDPLAAMAGADDQKLAELLASIETDNEGLQAMLEGLKPWDGEVDNPEAEWEGMPEFENETIMGEAFTCLVRFKSQDDRDEFAKLLGWKLSHKGNTYSTWFPKADFDQLGTKEGAVYVES